MVNTISIRWPVWYGHLPVRFRLYQLPSINDEWRRYEAAFLRWRAGWSWS